MIGDDRMCAVGVFLWVMYSYITQLCAYSYSGNTCCDAGRAADDREAEADDGDAHQHPAKSSCPSSSFQYPAVYDGFPHSPGQLCLHPDWWLNTDECHIHPSTNTEGTNEGLFVTSSYSWICSVIEGNMFSYDRGYNILWSDELMTWIEVVLCRFIDCTYEARNSMSFKEMLV